MTVNAYKNLKSNRQSVLNFISENMNADSRKTRDVSKRRQVYESWVNGFSGYIKSDEYKNLFNRLDVVFGSEVINILKGDEYYIVNHSAICMDNVTYKRSFVVGNSIYLTTAPCFMSKFKADYCIRETDIIFDDQYLKFKGRGVSVGGLQGTIIIGKGVGKFLGIDFDIDNEAIFIPEVKYLKDKKLSLNLYKNIRAPKTVDEIMNDEYYLSENNILCNRQIPDFVVSGLTSSRIPIPTDCEVLEKMTEWGLVKIGVKNEEVIWAEWHEDSTGLTHFVDTLNDIIEGV
jgi:hypothetical protein